MFANLLNEVFLDAKLGKLTSGSFGQPFKKSSWAQNGRLFFFPKSFGHIKKREVW